MRTPPTRAMLAVAIASLIALPFVNAHEAVPQAPAAHPSQPSNNNQSSNDLFVTVGKSVVVESALSIERISVGFGEIAEATAVSPREVLVNGKAPGETSLIIWQRGGTKQFFDVTVRPNRFVNNARLDGLRREIGKELPGQSVIVSMENDMVFLRGTVKDVTSSDRAVAIASTAGKVINLLYVNVPAPETQILLKVRFASVDRSLSNQLGMNIFSLGATNTVGSTSTQQFSPPPGINFQGFFTKGNLNTPAKFQDYTLSNALNLFFFRPDLDLGATIQALEVNGILQVLAEPNVLAENGKSASFLAGGEFPFPTVQGVGGGTGSGAVTIQFKQFGIRLSFTPTIMPNGTIHLQVAPEVSSLDFANGLSIQGFNVPALTVRRVTTDVDLGEGQSFAIGGLLDNRVTETFEKIPFIGDVPILGKFFQSRSRTKQNTELLVIVTPEIVKPIPAAKPLPDLKYPLPFMQPNTGKPMRTPGQNETGATPAPSTETIPIEKLMESMQSGKPAVADISSGSPASNTSNPTEPTAPPK